MKNAKRILVFGLQYVLALFIVFAIAFILNEWVFMSPPGSRNQGFPFAYTWFNSLPSTNLGATPTPGYTELPRSGWIVKGIVLDIAFYLFGSVVILFAIRTISTRIRKSRN